MRSNEFLALLGAATMLASFGGFAGAQQQMPSTTQGHPAMGRMRPSMMGRRPMSGSIIGNKNTKVYHLAGDKGNMPAEKNRVYFRSEREAMSAGYHLAKSGRGKMTMPHGMPMHKPMQMPMHPPIHPTPNSPMNGHLPK